jgi:hypothetical protein
VRGGAGGNKIGSVAGGGGDSHIAALATDAYVKAVFVGVQQPAYATRHAADRRLPRGGSMVYCDARDGRDDLSFMGLAIESQ